MIERTTFRLIVSMGLPLASALVLEQLPKSGVADVPFAFQVEQQTLPAGSYSVKQADQGRSVRIRNEKVAGTGLKCASVERKFGAAEGARLVFESYEGRYVLSEIWFDADGRGLILPRNKVAQGIQSSAEGRKIQYVHFQ